MEEGMNKVVSLARFDFHVHSDISHDGRGTILEYCERARTMGMKAVGFCEHVDLDPRDPVRGLHDYELYRERIREARERFGSDLEILMGAEVGYVPEVREEIRDFLCAHEYDYVVGSVHTIFEGAGVSDEYEALETFARHEVLDAYEEYFAVVAEAVVSGLFDVVGHLDLVQRYGVRYLPEEMNWGRFYGLLRKIFEGAMKREMAIEINTSGLRQAPESTYPCREILDVYRELGGKALTLGSDAHEPSALGLGIPVALGLAQELGLDQLYSFEQRIPRLIC